MVYRPTWTNPTTLAYLCTNWRENDKQIARDLKTTPDAVKKKRIRLGLAKYRPRHADDRV